MSYPARVVRAFVDYRLSLRELFAEEAPRPLPPVSTKGHFYGYAVPKVDGARRGTLRQPEPPPPASGPACDCLTPEEHLSGCAK